MQMAAAMLLAAAALPVAAVAQSGVTLSSQTEVETVSVDPGGERTVSYAPPSKVVPGDRLRFTITLTNGTTKPASALSFTDPLPREIVFDDTPDRDGFVLSVDDGKNYGALDALSVANADGSVRPATKEDVTHLRWTLADTLAPGQSKSVTFFGIVR